MKLEDALEYPTAPALVAGVIGWGRVFFDECWWRAERARVVALAAPDPEVIRAPRSERGPEISERWMRVACAFTEGASRLYGVPVLGVEALEEYTLRFGEEYCG